MPCRYGYANSKLGRPVDKLGVECRRMRLERNDGISELLNTMQLRVAVNTGDQGSNAC